METIEIEQLESPYTKMDQRSVILAPPTCCGGCSCCCCCSSSTFVIPEAIILNAVSKRKMVSRSDLYGYYLLIYGAGFVLYVGMIALIYFLTPAEELVVGLCLFGVFGVIIINPIIVGVMSDNAKQYDPDTKPRPLGLYVFLLGLLSVGICFLIGGAIVLG